MFQLRAQMDVTVSDLEWQEAWSLSQSGYSLFSGSTLSFGSEKEKAYSCDSVGGMGYTRLRIKRWCVQIRAVVWVVNVCVYMSVEGKTASNWMRDVEKPWKIWPAPNNNFLFSLCHLPGFWTLLWIKQNLEGDTKGVFVLFFVNQILFTFHKNSIICATQGFKPNRRKAFSQVLLLWWFFPVRELLLKLVQAQNGKESLLKISLYVYCRNMF